MHERRENEEIGIDSKRILIDRSIYRGCVEKKPQGSRNCRESIDRKAKRLDRKECVKVSVKKLSNLKKMSFSREEKHIKMNATSKQLKHRYNQQIKLSKTSLNKKNAKYS